MLRNKSGIHKRVGKKGIKRKCMGLKECEDHENQNYKRSGHYDRCVGFMYNKFRHVLKKVRSM